MHLVNGAHSHSHPDIVALLHIVITRATAAQPVAFMTYQLADSFADETFDNEIPGLWESDDELHYLDSFRKQLNKFMFIPIHISQL